MPSAQDKQVEEKLTHESLGALSKEQLIDTIVLQQAQIQTLMAQVEELKRNLGVN